MNTNFKKFVLVLVVIALALSVIGCGDGDKKDAPGGVAEASSGEQAADAVLAEQDADKAKEVLNDADKVSCALKTISPNFVCP